MKWSTLVLGGVGKRPLFVSLEAARRGGVMHVSPSFVLVWFYKTDTFGVAEGDGDLACGLWDFGNEVGNGFR